MMSFDADTVFSAIHHDAGRDKQRPSEWDIPTNGPHIRLVARDDTLLRAGDAHHPEFAAPDPDVSLSSQH